MQAQLEQRLHQLKTEYQTGQKMLADLEAKQADLHQTLLRISGAIQVLEELLQTTPQEDANGVLPLPAPVPISNGQVAVAA